MSRNPDASSGWLSRLAFVSIVIRIVAAGVLVFGPWTDEAAELDGWDVDRFQQIVDAPGTPYTDHAVEYPPMTVVIAEVLLADDVVSSHQRLVVLSLLVELTLAAVLQRCWRRRAAETYLLLSLPMVPSGLLRLDLWAALAAVIGAAAVASSARGRWRMSGVFAVATTVGAMIKLWPALLIAAALGIRSTRAALSAATLGLAAGVTWLGISGIDALEQVLSLRGATGWHLESIPGSLVALFSSETPRLEADAFRVGQINDTTVTVGRLVAVAVMIAATALASRTTGRIATRLALVMTVSVAALLVTAPLLSPQFLLWLAPWAAINHRDRVIVGLTAASISITAATLAAFGPPNLDHAVAALLLLVRDATLLATIVVGLRRLATSDWFEYA